MDSLGHQRLDVWNFICSDEPFLASLALTNVISGKLVEWQRYTFLLIVGFKQKSRGLGFGEQALPAMPQKSLLLIF